MGLHHITSVITAVPLCRHLVHDKDFHLIAFSLLLAAGVCYGTGQYKFTLDIGTRSGPKSRSLP